MGDLFRERLGKVEELFPSEEQIRDKIIRSGAYFKEESIDKDALKIYEMKKIDPLEFEKNESGSYHIKKIDINEHGNITVDIPFKGNGELLKRYHSLTSNRPQGEVRGNILTITLNLRQGAEVPAIREAVNAQMFKIEQFLSENNKRVEQCNEILKGNIKSIIKEYLREKLQHRAFMDELNM